MTGATNSAKSRLSPDKSRPVPDPFQTKSRLNMPFMNTLIFFRTQERFRMTGATETSSVFAFTTSHALSTSLNSIF